MSSLSEKNSRDLGLALYASAFTLPLFLPMLSTALGYDHTLPEPVQLLLASLVQFYAGARFYRRAWKAVKSLSLNMDVLIILGTSAAFGLSVSHLIAHAARPLYFDSAAGIITLVLWGQWLERRTKTPVEDAQRLVDRVSARFTLALTSVAGIVFILWGLWTGNWQSGVRPAVAVLVLACPCGLGLVLPAAARAGEPDFGVVRRKTKQNLFLAFIYNSVAVPLAALGLLSPTLVGLAMAFSSVSVIANSLSQRRS